MTEKLYEIDSHLFAFRATVTDCVPDGLFYAVTLDRTAFFPEGGGQRADTGTLGGARVVDVRERGGAIAHLTDAPLTPGEEVPGELDAEQRLRRMQNHSGEHLVSGLTHRLYGLDNVGFHMGEQAMTLDFNGELDAAQLARIETLANEAVRRDLPIRAWVPAAAELAALDYRSKKAIDGALRLVEIPGIDLCACCAPHVARTGEIGCVKILDAQRHRGGVRLSVVCGMDALDDYRLLHQNTLAVSALLSAKRSETPQAVQRLLRERDGQKERIAALSLELARLRAECVPETQGNLCVFDSILDEVALRELVNRLADKCTGLAAGFSGTGEEGYRYTIISRHINLRERAREINAAIGGRGGGSSEMLQGRCAGSEAALTAAVLGLV